MTESAQISPHAKQSKSLYDASAGEIFAKNFLAGFSHALGAVIIQIGFFVVVGYLATMYLWPQIQPMMNLLSRSVDSMEQLQQTMQLPAGYQQSGLGSTTPGTQPAGTVQQPAINSQMLQQLLQQYTQGTGTPPPQR